MKEELAKKVDLPRSVRWRSWRQGFLSRSWRWYSLDRNDPRQYLSDYVRFIRTPFINGRYSVVLDDKLLFYEVLSRHRGLLPARYCLLGHRGVQNLSVDRAVRSVEDVLRLLDDVGRLVLKPVGGGGGVGVHVLDSRDGYRDNGRPVSRQVIAGLLSTPRGHLVTEFVRQHPFSAEFLPTSANSIRILTMWDYDAGRPFVAVAVHRFASRMGELVDNFGRGGISVAIDPEAGVLGRGVLPQADWSPAWHDRHPATGCQFVGKPIAGWTWARDRILGLAAELPYIPYIGWDVVLTEDGLRVIEANNYSSMDLLQIHKPLLGDARVARFYRAHGVIR